MNHAHPRTIAHAIAHLTADERQAIASVVRSMRSPSSIVGLAVALGELGTLDEAGRSAVAGIIASDDIEADMAARLDQEITAAEARGKAATFGKHTGFGGGQ